MNDIILPAYLQCRAHIYSELYNIADGYRAFPVIIHKRREQLHTDIDIPPYSLRELNNCMILIADYITVTLKS